MIRLIQLNIRGCYLVVALVAVILTQPILAQDQYFEDFSELNLELLLNTEIITASRHQQKLVDSPVAISVITAEDLKQSGATNIPDALRMVAGLDVMAISASDFNVSARGFNNLSSNKMLVLIDGRSVYMDFYGIILWNFLPVDLDDVKRIEIIKGPGSSLYGANAFCGVINILTLPPDDSSKTQLSIGGGEFGTYATSLRRMDHFKKISYKISIYANGTNAWHDKGQNANEFLITNAVAKYQIDPASSLTISAGQTCGKMKLLPAGGTGFVNYKGLTGYSKAEYQRGSIHCQAFLEWCRHRYGSRCAFSRRE